MLRENVELTTTRLFKFAPYIAPPRFAAQLKKLENETLREDAPWIAMQPPEALLAPENEE